MFRLLLQTTPSLLWRHHCNQIAQHSTPVLLYLHLKSLSTKPPVSAADYLVTSLGISPESALKISTKVDLTSTSNADSVVAFLKIYGFSQTHIAEIVSKRPQILSSCPLKTLQPKLAFLVRNGISGEALFKLVTNNDALLRGSLHQRIVPAFNFLLTFLGSTKAVVSFLSLKPSRRFLPFFSEKLPINLQTLLKCGVPHENIVKLFLFGVPCLSHDTETFNEYVREVREMGVDPRSQKFVHCVSCLSGMSKDKREAKLEVFRSIGWTDEQIQAFFVRCPIVFCFSEERLKRALGIFMDRLEWTVHDLSKHPTVLIPSLDKRVLPRFPVLEMLISKGFENKTCVVGAFRMSEELFLKKFVNKYEKKVPRVLELYPKKISIRKV